jgi:hypothetical protein
MPILTLIGMTVEKILVEVTGKTAPDFLIKTALLHDLPVRTNGPHRVGRIIGHKHYIVFGKRNTYWPAVHIPFFPGQKAR